MGVNSAIIGPEVLVLALIAFSCLSAYAESPEDGRRKKTFEVQADYPLGSYHAVRRGKLHRITLRDLTEMSDLPQPAGADLPGRVSYAEGMALSIGLDDSDRPTLERLQKLRPLPAEDIHYLVVSGVLNPESLDLIATFRNLRCLMVDASPALETEAGKASLKRLTELEDLAILPAPGRPFGSKHFCDAVMGLKKLRSLSFPADKLTNVQLQRLGKHPSLESLTVETEKPLFSGTTLRALQQIKSLRQLAIICTDDVTWQDLAGFSELKNLEHIAVITDADPAIADSLKRLRPDCAVFIGPGDD